jgi:hypothetical protein
MQDCPHVSRTKEEFYTVRCQVTDMKNLYVSQIVYAFVDVRLDSVGESEMILLMTVMCDMLLWVLVLYMQLTYLLTYFNWINVT